VVLPAEDRAPPHRAVPTLDEESPLGAGGASNGSPLQGVPRVEGPAEDPVGRGAGGGRAGARSGTFCRREMQLGDYGCGKAGPG